MPSLQCYSKLLFTLIILSGIQFHAVSQSFEALDPEEKLIEAKFFDVMTVLVPASLKRQGNLELENMLDYASLTNEDGSVFINIDRIEDDDNIDFYKKGFESVKSDTRKIHRSEFIQINELKVYVLEVTGLWNGFAEKKESWIRIYATRHNNIYKFVFKYPEADRKLTAALRDKMIASFRLD